MSWIVIAFTNNGVVVADGAAAAAAAVNAARSGEAVAAVIRTADNAAPAVDFIKNVGDVQAIGANVAGGNLNALTKEAFASLLGMIAAAGTLPSVGPAGALAADAAMSEAFKTAYDAASAWSTRQDWSPFFDLLDNPEVDRPVSWIAPSDAIARGLLDPNTLLPRVPAPGVNVPWQAARQPTPRDPLAIDLDGDGIETQAVVTNGIPTLFDHDADGIRTGTGWLRPDDAWLVLDRNGNGTIDSGRELFGVDTLITLTQVVNGQTQTVTRNAANGFEALATLDTGSGAAGSAGYGDQIFNASDAQFANVRVWRDLNSDGISQAGELQSLAAAGIASIALNFNAANTNLGNGNTLTGTASVTRSNGSSTTAGSVLMQAGNLDLANQSAVERRPLRFARRVSGRTWKPSDVKTRSSTPDQLQTLTRAAQ